MIQFDETRPLVVPLSRSQVQDWPKTAQPNAAPPQTEGDAGKASDDQPFVSPPPTPFPRIFPGL
jgi:hypothetical protein